MQSTISTATTDKRSREAMTKARQLQHSAEEAAYSLFYGHDLRNLLDLVCRMNHFHVHNILLLLQQYPRATCLAGIGQWKSLLTDVNANALLIKPEWYKKGIDLIAPYTLPLGNNHFSLSWYALKQYDISQTTLTSPSLPPPVYISDGLHLPLLQESLIHVLSSEYGRSVVLAPPSSELRQTDLLGQMNDSVVLLRSDISPALRIHYLSECICLQELSSEPHFTPVQKDLLIQYIIYCLFRIWSLSPAKPLRQSIATLTGIPKEHQLTFIAILLQSVRTIEESVAVAYTASREGERPDF